MKRVVYFFVLPGVLLAGGAFWLSQRRNDAANGTQYTVVSVEHGRLVETVSATGVIQPRQLFQIGCEASGRVVEVLADFNQEVTEGQVLLRLDDQTARQQRDQALTAVEAARIGVRQAESALDTARKVLEREKTRPVELRREIEVEILTNQLLSAEAGIDGARIKVKQAEQALSLAELALSRTVVRAPVLNSATVPVSPPEQSGIGSLSEDVKQVGRRKFQVLERKVSLGQLIGPPVSAHLFTLAGGLDVIQIEAQVAEGDSSKVTKGLAAEFTVASYSETDYQFSGQVIDVRLLPVNDRGAIFYKVILKAKNERDPATKRWRLTPGLTATVDIIRRQHEKAWKMPALALSFEPEEAKLRKAAREKLRSWQDVNDHDQWRPVWVAGEDRTPWPVFVRVGGKDSKGESGIRDLSFTEVLEWDPDLAEQPVPGKPGTYPQVIIAAPAGKAGLFTQPKIKF